MSDTKVFFNDSTKKPNGFSISDGTVNNDYGIPLYGTGFTRDYNSGFQTSVFRLLDNAASSEAPPAYTEGQRWYDQSSSTLKLTTRQSIKNGEWITIGAPLYSNTQPSGSEQLWFDVIDNQLKVFDTEWTSVASKYFLLSGDIATGTVTFSGSFVSNEKDVVGSFNVTTATISGGDVELIQGDQLRASSGNSSITLSVPVMSTLETSVVSSVLNVNSATANVLRVNNIDKVTINDSQVVISSSTIHFDNNTILGVAYPFNPDHAVTRQSADDTRDLFLNQKVPTAPAFPVTETTMTGQLNVSDSIIIRETLPPIDETQPFVAFNNNTIKLFDSDVEFGFADALNSNKLTFTTVETIPITMQGSNTVISDVPAPTLPQHLANNQYATDLISSFNDQLQNDTTAERLIRSWIIVVTDGTSSLNINAQYNCSAILHGGPSPYIEIIHNLDELHAPPASPNDVCTIVGSVTVSDAYNPNYSYDNYDSVMANKTTTSVVGNTLRERYTLSTRKFTNDSRTKDDTVLIARFYDQPGLTDGRRFTIVTYW